MTHKIILALLIFFSTHNAFTYPITPQPLRKLILNSSHIVYADVVKVETKNKQWNNAKATLLIKEVVQGEIKQEEINVYFTSAIICPAPAKYEEGSTVLAFLNKKGKKYYTTGLSYGSKEMGYKSFEVYKERIIEMQYIVTIKDEEEKTDKTIDWLVECLANTYTRWEGSKDLSQSGFLYKYDLEKNEFIKKRELSDEQQNKLRKALFSLDQITYRDSYLISIIGKKNDTQLIDFLTTHLKRSLDENTNNKPLLMRGIAKYSDNNDLKEIVNQLNKIDSFDKKREQKVEKLASEFLSKL